MHESFKIGERDVSERRRKLYSVGPWSTAQTAIRQTSLIYHHGVINFLITDTRNFAETATTTATASP